MKEQNLEESTEQRWMKEQNSEESTTLILLVFISLF